MATQTIYLNTSFDFSMYSFDDLMELLHHEEDNSQEFWAFEAL